MSSVSIAGDTSGAVALTAPAIAGTVTVTLPAASGTMQTSVDAAANFMRSYLAGCAMSTAGASATMSIAAGVAADSTNVFLMILAALSKTTSAWAVGTAAGGLDTGAIANSTWYHFYVIRRPDTKVVDVVFSTNASLPTLPANYTQYRRIGSGKTNGSAQWIKFIQDGDDFTWDTPVMDSSRTGVATATTTTLASVPLGVRVKAIINSDYTGGGNLTYMSDLSNADLAPSLTAAPGSFATNGASTAASGNNVGVYTNTSQQIRTRESAATGPIIFVVIGWVDTRGRNA